MCWNQTVILHGWMKSIHGVLFHVSFLRGVKIIVSFFDNIWQFEERYFKISFEDNAFSKLDAYTITIFLAGRNDYK